MKVLGVHIQLEQGEVRKNVERAVRFIRFWAKEQVVDLVLLPELFTSGLSCTMASCAEPRDGDSVTAFCELAEQLDVIIGFGFVEDSGQEKPYNSYAIIEPGRGIYTYRKTHLHVASPGSCCNEPEYFMTGDALGLVDTRLGRLGIMTCYDGQFAEVPRSLVLSGAMVILWPSLCGGYFGDFGMVGLRARDNMVPIICADGSQTGDYPLTGHSAITDHNGNILSDYKGSEGVVCAEIDPDFAQRDRENQVDIWAMYRVRRPELYQAITRV